MSTVTLRKPFSTLLEDANSAKDHDSQLQTQLISRAAK